MPERKEIADPQDEVRYIEDIAKRRDFVNFSNDPDCFYRYCAMQAGSLRRDGELALAERVQDIGSIVLRKGENP
jgi:hypothetical protein